MQLGISLSSSHPTVSSGDAVAYVLERARAATAAGLDHLSLGDHHATGPSNYVQNVPMIGRIMADWPTEGAAARPIGLLLLLPLWHPVLAAEQVATLAAMTDAPFIVQTGIGHGAADFAALSADLRTRGHVTDAAIAMIKSLLAGDTADDERFHQVFGSAGASIAPLPPRPVEWWIGSGMGEVPLERAAREGDAWYVSPGARLDDLSQAIARYRERCAHHGTTPRVCLRRDVFVADTDAGARSTALALIESGYRGLTEDVLVFGGVGQVAERLAAFASIGVDDIVARTMSVPQDAALRSIELLGDVRAKLQP